MDFYLATNGNDRWSGRLPKPNRDKSDGPWATPAGALAALRHLRLNGEVCGPVTVHVRGGTYELASPLLLGPDDTWPLTFQAYRGEQPLLSGGRRISGWRKTTVNGLAAWVADLPEVREGRWSFRSLYVNGTRAPRPRLPREGLYRMAEVPGLKLPAGWGNGGQTQFVCAPGEVSAFRNLTDAEIVYLHFWIEERSPIAAFDPERNLVTMTRPSRSALVGSFGKDLADYYVDNVFEGLREPGQWYLDRPEGKLYYLPRRGETPKRTEIVAPRLLQLVACVGDPEANEYVEHIRFEGIRFAHTDWRHPAEDGAQILGSSNERRSGNYSRRHNRGRDASASQAASDVPGVIAFEAARHCAVENCVVEQVGWYAVEIGDACDNVRVVGCTMRDLGAGGVKLNGSAAREADVELRQTGNHRVTDNEIAHGGRVFHSAVGVLSMHAFRVTIAHNHIHDLFYSGVSVGWEWGYQASISHDNIIAYNHIHNIGQGLLSDMGGIYTLGVQPGTVIRGNLIYDVRSAHYGGWCIYPDEGSSHLLIENNVCFDADRNAFHQHYGRENLVINNIFAFGGETAAQYSRAERHVGFTFIRNIFVTDGKPMFNAGYSYHVADRKHRSDLNLFWDISGKRPVFLDAGSKPLSWSQWRALGYDTHSIVADPGFRSTKRRDLTLGKDSPALKLGFVPIDLSTVGPRPRSKRGADERVEPANAGVRSPVRKG